MYVCLLLLVPPHTQRGVPYLSCVYACCYSYPLTHRGVCHTCHVCMLAATPTPSHTEGCAILVMCVCLLLLLPPHTQSSWNWRVFLYCPRSIWLCTIMTREVYSYHWLHSSSRQYSMTQVQCVYSQSVSCTTRNRIAGNFRGPIFSRISNKPRKFNL